MTKDLEVLAMRTETDRLVLESMLTLGQLETHEVKLRTLVTDLRMDNDRVEASARR